MNDLLQRLETFDKAHGWDRYNHIRTDAERIDALQLEIINMLGELGELANVAKKCRRSGSYDRERLNEEATDLFIFFLKTVKTLDMDIEAEFAKKMDANDVRFAKQ